MATPVSLDISPICGVTITGPLCLPRISGFSDIMFKASASAITVCTASHIIYSTMLLAASPFPIPGPISMASDHSTASLAHCSASSLLL